MSAGTGWGQKARPEDSSTESAHPSGPALRRSRTDRVLGGVCGGLGSYLGIEPIWLRLGFIALAVAGAGGGVLLYVIAWVAIPEGEPQEGEPAAGGGRPNPPGAVLIGTGLIVAGLILLLERLAPWITGLFWPAMLFLIGAAILVTAARR
jgi:phage shock protein C